MILLLLCFSIFYPPLAVLTDLALSVVTALTQCKAHLNDVREGRQLAGALLFQILTSYLQVCDIFDVLIYINLYKYCAMVYTAPSEKYCPQWWCIQ